MAPVETLSGVIRSLNAWDPEAIRGGFTAFAYHSGELFPASILFDTDGPSSSMLPEGRPQTDEMV